MLVEITPHPQEAVVCLEEERLILILAKSMITPMKMMVEVSGEEHGQVTIERSDIRRNHAARGGGVFILAENQYFSLMLLP